LLSVESEEEVYHAVMKWAKAESKRANDGTLLYRLLQHVRLPLAKPQFLLDVVQLEPLIKRNRFVEQFNFKVLLIFESMFFFQKSLLKDSQKTT
jgi:hypothetical protein